MLKRIAVEHLRTGMYVQELCGSWMEHPFWRTQFLLDDPADLARLRASGIRQVWIDTGRGLDLDTPADAIDTREQADSEVDDQLRELASTPGDFAAAELHDEINRARRLVRAARPAVISMFNEGKRPANPS